MDANGLHDEPVFPRVISGIWAVANKTEVLPLLKGLGIMYLRYAKCVYGLWGVLRSSKKVVLFKSAHLEDQPAAASGKACRGVRGEVQSLGQELGPARIMRHQVTQDSHTQMASYCLTLQQPADMRHCCHVLSTQQLQQYTVVRQLRALMMKGCAERQMQLLHTMHQQLLQQLLLPPGSPSFLRLEVPYSLEAVKQKLRSAGLECTQHHLAYQHTTSSSCSTVAVAWRTLSTLEAAVQRLSSKVLWTPRYSAPHIFVVPSAAGSKLPALQFTRTQHCMCLYSSYYNKTLLKEERDLVLSLLLPAGKEHMQAVAGLEQMLQQQQVVLAAESISNEMQNAQVTLNLIPSGTPLHVLLQQLLPPCMREHWVSLFDGTTAKRSLTIVNLPQPLMSISPAV
ncbi:hypothetical protein COO60DRAFT_1460606 [Scenedesmus sp. NREL 46B-D3]|nr:hypothetical protein COO60DRAFT_1460606 [Scenedesmus sp. NREL 46B-D3]